MIDAFRACRFPVRAERQAAWVSVPVMTRLTDTIWSLELYFFFVYVSSEKDKAGTLLPCNNLLWLGQLSKNVPIAWSMLTSILTPS